MSAKHIKIIFIAIFFVLSLVPMVLLDVTPDKISLMENRRLKNMPTLSDHPDFSLGGKLINFVWDFETYIKDRIGFREQAVNFYEMVKPSVQADRYMNGSYLYLIGKQGHHFFASVGEMLNKMQGSPLLSDEKLIGLSHGLNNIAEYLNRKGIPMIFIVCPDKDSVYPEYLPKSISKASSPIPLDRAINHLQNNVNADVHTVKDALIAQKNNYATFNKSVGNLSHYNRIGGFFEYQELSGVLAKYFPEIQPMTFDDVTISYDNNAVPTVEMNDKSKVHELSPDFFDNIDVSRPFSWQNRVLENIDDTLPTILFMRDSYFNLFSDFVAQHFSKTIGIHFGNMKHFETYVDAYKPDVVVFETAERQFEVFANTIISYDNVQP